MANRRDELIRTIRELRSQRASGKERARVAYLADMERIDADLVPKLRGAMDELRNQHGFSKTMLGEVYGSKNRKTILDILAWGTAAPAPANTATPTPADTKFTLDKSGRVVVNWDNKTAVSDRERLNVTGDDSLRARLVTETAETDDLVREFEAWISRN